MQRIETSLPGVFELRPVVHRDTRGFFIETYHKAKFADLGIADAFVQDNHSRSVKGTLRGLHYQLHHPQAKLCRVVEGEALDVAVDIRVGSPTFGKCTSVLLTGKNGQVGAELLRLLPQVGEVVAFGHDQLDLSNPSDIRQTIREVRPQLIVNAAAYTAVDQAETDETTAQAVNAQAPKLMAEE